MTPLEQENARLRDLLARAMDDASMDPDDWYGEAAALLRATDQLTPEEKPNA